MRLETLMAGEKVLTLLARRVSGRKRIVRYPAPNRKFPCDTVAEGVGEWKTLAFRVFSACMYVVIPYIIRRWPDFGLFR